VAVLAVCDPVVKCFTSRVKDRERAALDIVKYACAGQSTWVGCGYVVVGVGNTTGGGIMSLLIPMFCQVSQPSLLLIAWDVKQSESKERAPQPIKVGQSGKA